MERALFFILLLPLVFTFSGCSIIRGDFMEEYDLEGASQLKVSLQNGSVSVTGWEEDYVRVQATWTVQGEVESDTKLQEFGRKIQIVPRRDGDFLELTAVYPPRPHYIHSASVSLALEAPREKIKQIAVKTTNGSLGFYHLQAGLAGGSSNGRITIEDCQGEINLETTNGQVILNQVRFLGEEGGVRTTNGSIKADIMLPRSGFFLLQTSNGHVDLRLPVWTEGTIRMKTVNGNIVMDQMPGAFLLRSEKDLLEIELHGGGMRLEVETSNGNINLEESGALFSSQI